jgi:CRISPR/Cas system endoribonuclease Cas6 (RAMP superfamily)
VTQIMEITGLGRASVYSYIPYSRTSYNAAELSLDAEKCRKYRVRKLAVEKLKKMVDADPEDIGEQLWNTIVLFENYTFHTVQGSKFRYTVQGQEILLNRQQESITKSSVNRAYEEVMELRAAGQPISEEKQLKILGASYVFPVFRRLRLIE